MARIKHIALVSDDPAKTAEFYKQHFGLTGDALASFFRRRCHAFLVGDAAA